MAEFFGTGSSNCMGFSLPTRPFREMTRVESVWFPSLKSSFSVYPTVSSQSPLRQPTPGCGRSKGRRRVQRRQREERRRTARRPVPITPRSARGCSEWRRIGSRTSSEAGNLHVLKNSNQRMCLLRKRPVQKMPICKTCFGRHWIPLWPSCLKDNARYLSRTSLRAAVSKISPEKPASA